MFMYKAKGRRKRELQGSQAQKKKETKKLLNEAISPKNEQELPRGLGLSTDQAKFIFEMFFSKG
jgi:hypothetical protein